MSDNLGATKDEVIFSLREYINELQVQNKMHLEALRRVSEALGNPFKGDMSRTCLDLGREVKRQLEELRSNEIC